MKQKLMLLFAGAFAVLAIGALPAVASAETLAINPETGSFPLTFSGATKEAKLTTSLSTIKSSAADVHGEFETPTTGWVEFTFTDVTDANGKTCTGASPPAPEGRVTTTTLPFHLIMIDSTAQLSSGKPGILITPGTGTHFASFTCPATGGITVGGNGIIGEISSPTCTEGTDKIFTNQSTIKFESSSTGVQKFQQVETAGTKFSLNAKTIIGTFAASEDAEGMITFARNAQLIC